MPLVTIITTIIEVAYFIYIRGLPGDYNDNILASPLLWRYERKSVWYIWITYSFCHGSVTHLLSNLFLKVFLGLFVEMEHKWLRVLIIYSLGVALGALFHSVVNPCTPLCGSSGGCYALLGTLMFADNVYPNFQAPESLNSKDIINISEKYGAIAISAQLRLYSF